MNKLLMTALSLLCLSMSYAQETHRSKTSLNEKQEKLVIEQIKNSLQESRTLKKKGDFNEAILAAKKAGQFILENYDKSFVLNPKYLQINSTSIFEQLHFLKTNNL